MAKSPVNRCPKTVRPIHRDPDRARVGRCGRLAVAR